MKSQNATATISQATACSGDTVLVPVNVTDFVNVGAMTIYIGYDEYSAEFISLDNINPAIMGGMNVNANNGEVGIAYTNINGFTISNGKLFDLTYLLTGTSTDLTFNPGTEIANIDLEVIPLDTTNGGISIGLVIVDQPDSVQAYPDTDVHFNILVSGINLAYHWEQNTGSGWQSLYNNSTYSGVTTDSLTVHDVTLNFNDYTYRCLVTAGNCDQYSDTALLEVALAFPVATIGPTTSCPEESILAPLFVGDFLDVIEFTFNISFEEEVLEFISLENIHPDLSSGTLTTEPLTNPNGISIHWEGSGPVSLNSATLFDMQYQYSQGSTPLAFAPGTQVLNSMLNLVNITLTNGYVHPLETPVILTQPESQTVRQGDAGIFTVEANGAVSYQWQVSTDDGQNWTDLTDVTPYYNTATAELTINPVVWGLNDYQYSCVLFGDFCAVQSAAAILSVDTLTGIVQPGSPLKPELLVAPNPAGNSVTLTYYSDGNGVAEILIFSADGRLMDKMLSTQMQAGENQEVINLSGYAAGVYFVEVQTPGNRQSGYSRAKLLKSVHH